MFLLQQKYIDVTTGNNITNFTASNSIIFTEPGNPGLYNSIGGNSGFGTGILSNASNDSMFWNSARLFIRGVSLNTGTTGSTFSIQPYILSTPNINSTNSNIITLLNNFTVTDLGTLYGYSTWVSPWFSTNQINTFQSIGIFINSTHANIRIGPTYIQYKN